MKFVYYIGDPSAEKALLGRFPQVQVYWEPLSAAIRKLPPKARQADVWKVAGVFFSSGDRACLDAGASFKLSDIIGVNPVLLAGNNALVGNAASIFRQSFQDLA